MRAHVSTEAPTLTISERCTLDRNEANRLWTWILARQGLALSSRFSSAPAIAEATLGLHAARLKSPFATVLARSTDSSVALEMLSPAARRELVTLRCMRKTLHVLSPRVAGAAHAATISYRRRDALKAITNADLNISDVDRCIRAITDLLAASGPMFYRTIETYLVDRSRSKILVRLALKLAWETGLLAYLNCATGWNREDRRFDLMSRQYPAIAMDMNTEDARRILIQAYFERYGPASLRDAMWWSGLPKSSILEGLRSADRDIVAIRTPWADAELFMFLDSFETFQGIRSRKDSDTCNPVCFLAHEDVALKAYFETRDRYLQGASSNLAFNQIGEALPTILFSGRVIGTWVWNTKERSVEWSLIGGAISSKVVGDLVRQSRYFSKALYLGMQE